MLNAMGGYGGLRCGEAAGRRWRDWLKDTPSLTCLSVHSQYQDQPLKTARGTDRRPRGVPVHPVVERMLQGFWDEGFEQIYGRPPTIDDFIVPDPRTMQARTESQVTHAHRRDAKRLGVEYKGTHAFRRHFVTHIRKHADVRRDMLEKITHNSKGDILDLYTEDRALWSVLCEQVMLLDVRGQVISLGRRRGL